MPQGLWVEHKTDTENYIHLISVGGCEFVAHFLDRIGSGIQLGIPRGFRITLHGPSGMAIGVGDPISSLVPGNSFANPLRAQVSAPLPSTTELSTSQTSTPFRSFWQSILIRNGILYFSNISRLFQKYLAFLSATNAELTSFWNSLRDIKNDEGFLHFTVFPTFFPDKFKVLYIRKAYEDLFKIICGNLEPTNPENRLRGMALTGTPGIGKSIFLFYILWRLANAESTKTVILHRRSDRGNIFIFQNNGCRVACNLDRIDGFLNDPSTWYLTDALLESPDESKAVTIVVSSPARRYYSEFLKRSHVAPLHYLPTWSLEELQLVAPFYPITETDIKDRYNMIGGIPRYVIEKKDDLDELIRHAVGRIEIKKFPLIVSGSVSKEDQVSHLIVQFVVDTASYLKFTLQMASSYATEKAMELFISNQEEEMKRFILNTTPLPALATLRGPFFEAYAHQKLAKGGKFIGRSLENCEECESDFSTMKISRFSKVSDCMDPKPYYVPWYSNNPCIDSVVLNKGYFQMTITSEHDSAWSKLKEMVDELKMDKLYFVVPHTIFKEFQRQKLVGNMESPENANKEETSMGRQISNEDKKTNMEKRRKVEESKNKGNSLEDLVHQYIIPISLESNLEALLSKILHKEQMTQQNGKDKSIAK
jgi:hypothetical protein